MLLAEKKLLHLFLASLISVLVLAQGAEAKSQIKALQLSQTSSAWGACTVFITDNAIRIDAQARGFYVLSKAPNWNIEIGNEKKKKIFKADTAWSGFSIHRLSCNLGRIKDYKAKKTTFMGLPATEYSSTEKIRSEDLLAFNRFEKTTKKTYISNTNYTVAQCKNVPTPAAFVLTQFYDMPRGSLEVPVRLISLNEGQKRFRLLTKEIKEVTVEPAIFANKNYLKAARAEELLLAAPADVTEEMLIDSGLY